MTEVEEEEEEASQQGTHHSFGDGGMKILPCGQNDLKVVWNLKHNCDVQSVSPIINHTPLRPRGFRPAGQPVTKGKSTL